MTGAGMLQEYLIRQAQRRPDAVALVHRGNRLTYGQLDSWTNKLARLLAERGCRRGDRVCILLPKSFEAIAGMLGVLKCGAIYVPMDTASPAARLRMVIDSAESRFILAGAPSETVLGQIYTAGQIASGQTNASLQVGWMTERGPARTEWNPAFTTEDLPAVSGEALDVEGAVDDIAHILFTSGSTGVPKGVAITHANVRHFVEWATRYFGHTAEDRISGHPPLHFDLSTFDVFGTLAAGAQLHLVPQELNLLPHRLADFINKSELTQWFSVPSLLNYMAKLDAVRENDFPSLRRLLWCGESFPITALIHWMRKLPHVTFTNLYGPTEATIASSYYRMPACPANEAAAIPIGQACAGESLYVLGPDLDRLPAGEKGDLYIGGAGLSPGYWKNPAATAAAFIEEPASGGMGRIYRTGDLASEGPDGLIYLHGRADHQIKTRGYRVELGDIEQAIHSLDFIRECAVVAIDSEGFEGKTICCALVTATGSAASPEIMREKLASLLPGYMIPSQWCTVPALPVNGNGKIDRRRIRESFEHRANSVAAASS